MYGGSYITPIKNKNRPSTEYTVSVITAHGIITPEYYYIVPDNTILLMPDVCGRKLIAKTEKSEYIFMEPKEALIAFKHDFMSNEDDDNSNYRAYFPGDILPFHIFTFYSVFKVTETHVTLGIVGKFSLGALYENAIQKYLQKKNTNYIVLNNHQSLQFYKDILQNLPKKYEKYVAEIAYVYLYKPLLVPYKEAVNDVHNTILGKEPEYIYITGISMNSWAAIFLVFLPLISQNELSGLFFENRPDLTEKRDLTGYRLFMDQLIPPRSPTPQIFILNTCRSLKENLLWNESINTKPSMKMVRAINAYTETNLNFKVINELLVKNGLPAYNSNVIHIDIFNQILQKIRPFSNSVSPEFVNIVKNITNKYNTYKKNIESNTATTATAPATTSIVSSYFKNIPVSSSYFKNISEKGLKEEKEAAKRQLAIKLEKVKRDIRKFQDSSKIGTKEQKNMAKVSLKQAHALKKEIEEELAKAI